MALTNLFNASREHESSFYFCSKIRGKEGDNEKNILKIKHNFLAVYI